MVVPLATDVVPSAAGSISVRPILVLLVGTQRAISLSSDNIPSGIPLLIHLPFPTNSLSLFSNFGLAKFLFKTSLVMSLPFFQ